MGWYDMLVDGSGDEYLRNKKKNTKETDYEYTSLDHLSKENQSLLLENERLSNQIINLTDKNKGFEVICNKCNNKVDMISYKNQWYGSIKLKETLNKGVILTCECGNKVL